MGEAKRRGSAEERKALAIAQARSRFPPTVACNACEAELHDIQPLDPRGMPGLQLAGAAHCKCGNTTYVFDGTAEALAAVHEMLAEKHGEHGKIGFVPKPVA